METTKAGVTAFAPPPAPRYRFLITVSADKVQLMLEDYKSKMQWRGRIQDARATGFLEQKEYLTSTNTIPDASVNDYVKIFKGALEYLRGDCEDASANQRGIAESSATNQVKTADVGKLRRKLTLGNQSIQLELTAKIRVLTSAWSAQYLFKLEPIPRKRIDVLEAKLQEAEEQLVATKRSLAREKEMTTKLEAELGRIAARVSAIEQEKKPTQTAAGRVSLVSTRVVRLSDKGQIGWQVVISDGTEVEVADHYGIRFLVGGWYSISFSVTLTAINYGTSVELRTNGTCTQCLNVPVSGNQSCTVSFSSCVFIYKDEVMTLVATGNPLYVAADFNALKLRD